MNEDAQSKLGLIVDAFGDLSALPSKQQKIVLQYATDIREFVGKISRVLKPGGRCVYVVGNSCLRGVFIKNSSAVAVASQLLGLKLVDEAERELPESSRYLPITVERDNSIGRRMRTEMVMTFEKTIQ